MKLINLTNHTSLGWSEEQKRGWELIIDIPFPNIPAEYDEEQVFELAKKYEEKILEIAESSDYYVCLQGEFFFCYILFSLLNGKVNFAIPTTDRIVVVKNGVKESKFEFKRWRKLERGV